MKKSSIPTPRDKVPSCGVISHPNSKLLNLFILNLAFCILILLPLPSEAKYRIYLKNGQVISGASNVKQEAGKVKIYKSGIMLELPKTNVIKIEEYNQFETTEKETVEQEKSPAKEKPPEYLRYEEAPPGREQEIDIRKKLEELKARRHLIVNKLERIETLENKGRELQKQTHQKWSPRKARIARKEKAEVDKELESLSMEKDLLLKQKKELETQIDILERR